MSVNHKQWLGLPRNHIWGLGGGHKDGGGGVCPEKVEGEDEAQGVR